MIAKPKTTGQGLIPAVAQSLTIEVPEVDGIPDEAAEAVARFLIGVAKVSIASERVSVTPAGRQNRG
jgi:hypothetical protein